MASNNDEESYLDKMRNVVSDSINSQVPMPEGGNYTTWWWWSACWAPILMAVALVLLILWGLWTAGRYAYNYWMTSSRGGHGHHHRHNHHKKKHSTHSSKHSKKDDTSKKSSRKRK